MAYREDQDGTVIITLTHADYDKLLLCLGYASGSAMKEQEYTIADSFLELANSVNQGNPQWRPYETLSTKAFD